MLIKQIVHMEQKGKHYSKPNYRYSKWTAVKTYVDLTLSQGKVKTDYLLVVQVDLYRVNLGQYPLGLYDSIVIDTSVQHTLEVEPVTYFKIKKIFCILMCAKNWI